MAYQSATRFRKRRMSEINVVPYIDVMLVLLVIFMVTAPLLSQGVDVDLPEANAKVIDTQQQEPVIVSIDKNGKFYLNLGKEPGKPVEASELVRKVSAVMRNRKQSTIYVRGDKNVNYGKVVSVMALLQQAGVGNVGLMTDLSEM
ncbi:MAG: protein TolR [Gammaproteobacteria bacterium]|jgi:biopolymer transport protein TolR